MAEKKQELTIGAVISSPGNTTITKTGAWRSFRPVLHQDICKKCGQCWMVCPEGAIERHKDGSFHVNYDYCKGCMLCMKQCPFKAISKEVEQK